MREYTEQEQIRNENEQGNKDSSCGCRGYIDYVLRNQLSEGHQPFLVTQLLLHHL